LYAVIFQTYASILSSYFIL